MKKKALSSRLTAWLLAVLLSASLLPVPASAAGTAHFADVAASHWAYSYVEKAYGDGAIVGTGGDPAKGTGVFSPDTAMTYGQFLTMMMNAFYPDEMAQASQTTPWYAPAIQVAVDRKLTYITQERLTEVANNTINRYNMSWILMKILKDRGGMVPTTEEKTQAAAKIGDWETVQSAANGAWNDCVSGAVAAGLISGVDDQGTFNGTGQVTRAAAAVIYTKLAGELTGYHITFNENWELITVPGYAELMEEVFFESYPRLVARWGSEETQRTVPVTAYTLEEDAGNIMAAAWNYNGTGLRYIKVSPLLQEKYPASHSTAHELTHVVASYTNFDSSWWRECIADYGRFRYYKWADEANLDAYNYFQASGSEQRDWYFTSYGGQWFFAWMDYKYPTTPKGDGLIDAIHHAIKSGQITCDDVSDPNLNAVVKKITGYNTIAALHQQYIKELDSGAWVFRGFAGYQDNYITENIPGVPNPTYPTGANFNLCTGSRAYRFSGEDSNQYAANYLVDGDLTTKWQDSQQEESHTIGVDLGKYRTFDSYTLYHAGSQGSSQQNTADWRLSYYDAETESWVTIDRVSGNTQSVTNRTFDPVTARYVWLNISNASGTGDNIARLYELELYSTK